MKTNNTYIQFVQEVKQQILQNRYQAARLVNKELLLLYYNIGKMLNEKIKQAKWGDKVLQNISADLQKELPVRGFSAQNLKKIRVFYEAYLMLLQHEIGPSTTNQFAGKKNLKLSKKTVIGSLATVDLLQHHIESDVYNQKGKLPNNSKATLPEKLAAHALDEQEKLPQENNRIDIILGREKSNKVVEYAFKSIDKSTGMVTYKISRPLPAQFKKVLPNAEALKKLL